MEASVHEAKTHLSRLLDALLLGEEIIITRSGKPVARLVPFEPRVSGRRVGSARGQFQVPEDFNAPLDAETESSFWR